MVTHLNIYELKSIFSKYKIPYFKLEIIIIKTIICYFTATYIEFKKIFLLLVFLLEMIKKKG